MTDPKDKNYWPIALFSIPFAAVLFGIVMISTAVYFPDDVVVDQYYKEGMAINERIADSEQARALGIEAKVHLDGERVTVAIAGTTNSLHQLNFHHVTDENRDIELKLVKQGEQFIALDSASLIAQMQQAGVWYIELVGVELEGIETGWRLSRRLETPALNFEMGVAHGS